MTCSHLQKKAERFAYLCIEQAKLKPGDHVALLYSPGIPNSLFFISILSLILTQTTVSHAVFQ